MPASAIHVVPQSRGGWEVRRQGAPVALSEHGTETDAERRALAMATASRAPVVVHDRYSRVRVVRTVG